jgi:hypothetical protein
VGESFWRGRVETRPVASCRKVSTCTSTFHMRFATRGVAPRRDGIYTVWPCHIFTPWPRPLVIVTFTSVRWCSEFAPVNRLLAVTCPASPVPDTAKVSCERTVPVILVGAGPAILGHSDVTGAAVKMARHTSITRSLGVPVYFCDSRSPWQRGSNENTNGLLRDYFPKGTDLNAHSAEHLIAVENELNARPRIVLNDRPPQELFNALIAS